MLSWSVLRKLSFICITFAKSLYKGEQRILIQSLPAFPNLQNSKQQWRFPRTGTLCDLHCTVQTGLNTFTYNAEINTLM
jgi:hypothetical protein